VIKKMTERLAEPNNAALYERRGATVEPVNAHLKDGPGLRLFSRRGLAAVESELTSPPGSRTWPGSTST
jgi:hypothetical protein